MIAKGLRWTIYVLSIIVLLITVRYPLLYLGLIQPPPMERENTPFYEIAIHFVAWVERRDLWFLLHILGSMVALALGPAQFMEKLRSSRPSLHRSLGYAYFLGIFLGGVGGLVIATRAWGGPITAWGFSALSIVWLASSAMGLRLAKARRFREHQSWMRLSYAITLTAVSLRVQMPLLLLAGLSELHIYQVVSWSAWIPQVVWWLLRGRHVAPPASPISQPG